MKIAVTSPSFSQNPHLVNLLERTISAEFLINQKGKRFNDNELIDYLAECDAVIVGLEKLSASVLQKLPKLKFIAKYGVGLDNIDLDYCKQHDIKIGWSGGVNRLSVAEMVLGFMLSLSRNLYSTNLLIRKGEWKKNGGFELSGKKVGIIGFGHIGKEVARLLAPFRCDLMIYDVQNKTDEISQAGGHAVSLEELFKKSDLITIHIPFNGNNTNFINYEKLSCCKRQPILINTSRGGIVNESDLLKALNENLISFYAADVFEVEPCPNKELLHHERVFATPHIGGNSKEAVILMGESAIRNLSEIIK